MAEIPALLSDADFRERAVANVTNPQVRLFWENYARLRTPERQLERADSTLNKLDEFLTQPIVTNIVGQSRTTADFRKFMDEGKIVLVPLGLGRLGEPVVSLLGSLIVLQVLNAALSRENQTERRQFNLYADEYQRFATPAFATLLTEARKYGVATTIAHQTRAQLDIRTRAAALNAGNLVVFAVHGEDAEEMAKQFDRSPPDPVSTRDEAIRTISQDPIGHLVHNGHEDLVVRQIVGAWLSELEANASQLPEGQLWSYQPRAEWGLLFHDEGAYYASRATMLAGLRLLNTYLVDWMEDRIEFESLTDRILEILLALRGFFQVAADECPVDVGPFRSPEGQYKGVVRVPWVPSLGERELRVMVHAILLGNHSCDEQVARYGAKRAEIWQMLLQDMMGWDDAELVKSRAVERGLYEARQAQKVILNLMLLGTRLKEKPVLVNSGQWEPVKDHARLYGDVEAEISSRLVNQGQFRATCKITQLQNPVEHRIRTPSFHLLDEAHSSREATIRSQSRSLYCLTREEVQAEVLNRRSQPGQMRPPPRITGIDGDADRANESSRD